MSIYDNNSIQGELWLRDLKQTVRPATQVLSSIYAKYQSIYPTFFNELTSNQILRFDMFYDTIFIETESGCIFEKIYIEDEKIKPFNQLNFFNIKRSTSVDYWFDETKNKIFYTDLYLTQDYFGTPTNFFDFILTFRVFDCTTGLASNILLDLVRIGFTEEVGWNSYQAVIENPKITYNVDTKYFNISFLVKNQTDETGILSFNILGGDTPSIKEINGFLPFMKINSLTSGITAISQYPTFGLYLATTEDGYIIETEFGDYIAWDSL